MVFDHEEELGNMSLDGRSLIVPDYGDADDMSSLGGNSKVTYRGDREHISYIGNKKIVKKPSDMSSLEKKLASYQGDPEIQSPDYGVELFDNSLPSAVRKDTELSQSFEKNDDEKSKRSKCVPKWIAGAPLWLKIIIIASVALLVGALVLIVVGAQLTRDKAVLSSVEDENTSGSPGLLEDATPQLPYPGSESVSATFSPETPALVDPSSPSTSPSFTTSVTVPTIAENKLPTSAPTSAPTTNVDPLDTSTSSPTTSAPTDSPTTTEPTSTPTAPPSGSPTLTPTQNPTHSPTTTEPTSTPTAPPTGSPTLTPTQNPTNSPTLNPTENPTQSPTTSSPTQSPTISMVNFFVMGGRFDGEEKQTLVSGLQTLPSFDDNTILVHLGDWNSPYTTSCVENSFTDNVQSYQKSTVPVYFVPGDNEYNDCPNPTQALGLWNQYFLNFETKYWEDPSWEVLRQLPNYAENFAFLQREILFVGINLVGGIVHDQAEWDARHDANLLWIDTTAAKYDGTYTTMVVLAHADPDIGINQNFFQYFYPMVESYDEKVIFVHRNLGIDTWNVESGYNGISNLDVVSVEGSKWPPMWIQIDPTDGKYKVDQSDWYDEYISKGKLPKNP